MTLLERYDAWESGKITLSPRTKDEIRRALAIAQAVDEYIPQSGDAIHWIMRRADELLRGEK